MAPAGGWTPDTTTWGRKDLPSVSLSKYQLDDEIFGALGGPDDSSTALFRFYKVYRLWQWDGRGCLTYVGEQFLYFMVDAIDCRVGA